MAIERNLLLALECDCSGVYNEFYGKVSFTDMQNQFGGGKIQVNDHLSNFTPFNLYDIIY